ncbi:MAG: hypothetical protein HN348_25915 [Proteobacteria bacterium]|jgi:hypothetical protein|nr:hypothetical protein [Pseudomonadota bacterium]
MRILDMTKRLMVGAGFLAVVGCTDDGKPSEADDTDTDGTDVDDTDDTADTADTDLPSGVPYFFGAMGTFAIVDGEISAYTTYDSQGNEIEVDPTLAIILAPEDWSGDLSDPTQTCFIELVAGNGATMAPWADTTAAYAGFSAPADATVSDFCMAWDFKGVQNSSKLVSEYVWGVGLNDISADVTTRLQQQLSAAQWNDLEPYVVGGGFYLDLLTQTTEFSDGYVDGTYAVGVELDGNNKTEVDGKGEAVRIPKAEVSASRDGAYSIQPGTVLAPYDGLFPK